MANPALAHKPEINWCRVGAAKHDVVKYICHEYGERPERITLAEAQGIVPGLTAAELALAVAEYRSEY